MRLFKRIPDWFCFDQGYSNFQQLMDCPRADRLPLLRLALASDRERLAAEQAAFEKLKARLDAEECHPLPAKRIRQFLEEAAPDFVPLEFDEKGNSRPADLQLEEQQSKSEVEEVGTLFKESPRTLVKCTASVEEGAWPEWEEEDEGVMVAEEAMDFQPTSSPGVDITNVVVEEEEEVVVNNFGVRGPGSPLNGLSVVRRLYAFQFKLKRFPFKAHLSCFRTCFHPPPQCRRCRNLE